MSTFTERLRHLRKSRNMNQEQLAEAIKVSKSTIAMYEQGRREPGFETQELLADFFNVDIDYLVGRSDRTTVVIPALNGNPKRRFLMDKIAKADDKKLKKIEKLMEFIDGDDSAE